MSFSADHAKGSHPLAVIRWPGERFNGTIVWFNPEEPPDSKEGKEEKKVANLRDPVTGESRTPMGVLGRDFFKLGREGRKIQQSDVEGIERILDEDEEQPDWSQFEEREDLVKKKIAQAKKELASRRRDFYLEKDGWIDPLVDDTARECVFITGPAGAGKSVYASKKMKHYARLFPENKIYLISKVRADPAFEGIPNLVKLTLDDELVKAINTDALDFHDCMVVFDDVDSVADDKKRKAIFKLRADLLETGRHGSCYIINTSHVYFGGEKTLTALRESTEIVVFPKHGEKHYLPDFLKKIGGLDKAQIQQVMDLGSRWVSIHRKAPRFLLYSRVSECVIEYQVEMEEVVRGAMKYSLSEDDVRKITKGQCKIVPYAELNSYSSLQEAAGPTEAAICLVETKESYGHWVCWFRVDENTWEWFDSYGIYPDSELEFVSPEFLRESGQEPIILKLLKGAQADVKMIFNQVRLQSKSPEIDTCGRWAAVRIRKRKLALSDFQKVFKYKTNKLSPDELVTIMTLL